MDKDIILELQPSQPFGKKIEQNVSNKMFQTNYSIPVSFEFWQIFYDGSSYANAQARFEDLSAEGMT